MGQFSNELKYLVFACAACISLPIFGACILGLPYFRNATLPWFERARRLWPLRTNLSADVLLLPLAFAILPHLKFRHSQPLTPVGVIWAFCFVAVIHSVYWIQQRTGPFSFRYGDFWKRWLAHQMILGSPVLLALVANFFTDDHWTSKSTIQFFFVCMFFLFHLLGGVLWIFRKIGWVTAAPDFVRSINERIAIESRIRPPDAYVLPLLGVTAFAHPPSHQLWFSDLLLNSLSPAGCEAICRHEISHLSESRWVLLSRLIYLPFLLLVAMARPLIGELGIVWMFALLLTLLAGQYFRRLWRKMEERADAAGAKADSLEYARALEKLYEANLIPVVLKKNQTHPDLFDRLENVGAKPDYPRPKPPARASSTAVVVIKYGAAALLALCNRSSLCEPLSKWEFPVHPTSPKKHATSSEPKGFTQKSTFPSQFIPLGATSSRFDDPCK